MPRAPAPRWRRPRSRLAPGCRREPWRYLLAEAAEAAGDRGAAALAYQAAAQAEGRLSADGPLVKSLASRALERLK